MVARDARGVQPVLEIDVQPRNFQAARGGQRFGHERFHDGMVAAILLRGHVVDEIGQTLLALFFQLFGKFVDPGKTVHVACLQKVRVAGGRIQFKAIAAACTAPSPHR